MKNARIFLVLLLIVATVALAGCATTDRYDTNLNATNRGATGAGIVNDLDRTHNGSGAGTGINNDVNRNLTDNTTTNNR